MANPFVHVELSTQDLPKAKQFYGDLFDWKLEEVPQFHYTLIGVGEGVGGGMMAAPNPNVPSHWLPYVDVADINASSEKAKSLGANIIHGPMEVPDVGWICVLIDPTGAAIGLFQPKRRGG
jgi:predicted enzyme related to lactoylglutathione lyase